jgi:hypothetical protein
MKLIRVRPLSFVLAALLLSLAVNPVSRASADDVHVARWEPHDFAFTAEVAIENPFKVSFAATVRSPDGREFTQPGFYDGDGTWKVRVSALQAGAWTLVTRSDVPALDGRQAAFTCTGALKPGVHGALRVDAAHPHHFVFEDGARYYLLGYECDWLWALDPRDPGVHRGARLQSRHLECLRLRHELARGQNG